MTEDLIKNGGVLLVDKPAGMTSHDVVDRVRKVAGTRRVGHTGTLDPMAEGLLIICLGRATRISQFLTGLSKKYRGGIKLGEISSTYDREGSIMAQDRPLPADRATIEQAMQSQRGQRIQLAPPYSAVKVRGKKLYEYARQGEEVPQKHRKVFIHRFEMLDYCEPEINFLCEVGSGTYVRSMAHDLGIQLGCGAYLSSLTRDSVGNFRIEDAIALNELIQRPELLHERILDMAQALAHLPRITVDRRIEKDILNGGGFTSRDILECAFLPRPMENSVVVSVKGQVLSVVRGEPLANGDQVSTEVAPHRPIEYEAGVKLLYFRPVRVLGQA